MEDINLLVKKAKEGEQIALEKIIISIKDKIYNFSLRMLWNPDNAEDVTQEILIKIITNLSTFRGDSKFSTWVYSIASNHLINANKSGLEKQNLSFEIMQQGVEEGFSTKNNISYSGVDENILTEELKISCTHAMLLCLKREQRIIYILSSMFEINSSNGAEILDITAETYRKRLSRARKKMSNFMENNCGLVNPDKDCRCKRRIEVAIENHRINPDKLIFVNNNLIGEKHIETCKNEMEAFDKISAVFKSNPYYITPKKILHNIKQIIQSKEYKLLEN